MKRKAWLMLLGSLFFTAIALAQEEATEDTLFLKEHVTEEGIKLRWAPANKYLWEDGLKHGYRLIRKIIMRDGILLEKPIIQVLADNVLPAPGQDWKDQMLNDPMVAVVAQAIFGSSFETSGGGKGNNLAQAILESDELTRRFAFALYACDMSFKAAGLSGLAYIDTTANTNEAYIYEVTLLTSGGGSSTRGIRYVRASDTTVLPIPDAPVAIAKDSIVTLTWNYRDLAGTYTAYIPERSKDGIHYEAISETPVTALSMDVSGNITYADVPGAHGPYWYRLKGVDVFGESGPASSGFKVMLSPPFTAQPNITRSETGPAGAITLFWEVEQKEGEPLKMLELHSAPHPREGFSLLKANVSSDSGNTRVVQQSSVVYYKLKAVDQYQRTLESPAFMVQLPDTIPPGKPLGLKGDLIENKVIQLTWNGVTDRDLLGYDIYFAPAASAPFSRLNTSPQEQTEFKYHLSTKNSLKNARFMIRAVDRRYNESTPSDTVAITFTVPPVAPVIRNYRYRSEHGLRLEWAADQTGSNTEVRIYRQDKPLALQEKWKRMAQLPVSEAAVYTDADVAPGHTYRYMMTAVNMEQQESRPSDVITITVPGNVPKEVEGSMHLIADREFRAVKLHWKYGMQAFLEIRLYRCSGGGKFSLYKTFPPDRKGFVDTDVAPNNQYGYLLVGLSPNGGLAPLAEDQITF